MRRTATQIAIGLLAALIVQGSVTRTAGANDLKPDGPLAPLVGWWSGEGRLGFKEGQTEAVKCRATYIATATRGRIEQNIRCAAASGAIEVRADVTEDQGKLTGSWTERLHNLSGNMTGDVTPRGFRVDVAGPNMRAGMDIMVRGDRQIVEIQFYDSTLVGLSLLLQKGAANRPPS